VLSDREYNDMFAMQQASMAVPVGKTNELPPVPVANFAEEDEEELVTVGVGSTKRVVAATIGRKITPPTIAAPQKPTVSWVKVDSAAK